MNIAMEERVRVRIADGVADVRLHRPEKMNAIDADMMWSLARAGERLRADPGVRAVVISGEGRGFCAGLDLDALKGLSTGNTRLPFTDLAKRSHGVANWAQHIVWQWREMPVPVIAAVHGVAVGGGLQLALGADLRYAAPECKFGITEIKWGLVPDMAGTQLMRHLVREDIVRELTFTGRTFSAAEACDWGFVTRVVDEPLEVAMEAAREMAARSPDAIRAAKRLLNLAVACDAASGLLAETEEQRALLGTPNQVEAVAGGREVRRARFRDPLNS
jgi:enoyl-CoA hydratase/carnithine racemase